MINLGKIKDRFYSQDKYMAFPVGKKSLSNLLKICHQKWDIFNDFVKELDGVHWLLKAVLLLAFIIQQEVFWGFLLVWTFNSLWEMASQIQGDTLDFISMRVLAFCLFIFH